MSCLLPACLCSGAPVEVEEYVDPDDVPEEERDKVEDKGTKALANRQVKQGEPGWSGLTGVAGTNPCFKVLNTAQY
jgi:hypothetical protein